MRSSTLIRLSFALIAGLAGCSDDTDGLDPADCMNNDGCPADQFCDDGTCTAGSGNDCEDDTECTAPQVCNVIMNCGATRCSGNTCVDQKCVDHVDCPAGFVCRDEICAAPESCDDTGACLDGLICNADNLCVPPGEVCTDDAECSDDGTRICVFGMCRDTIACTNSEDCPSDLRCIQGECREPCTENGDCGDPAQVYNCIVDTGECQQRCTQSDQCPMGQFCSNFLCFDAECTQDSDCDTQNSEECQGEEDGRGQCVVVMPCGPNGECDLGSYCDTATNRCLPATSCRTDRDCGADEFCNNGYCEPAQDCTNSPCEAGFDCVNGICVPFVCRSNADCISPEICSAGLCITAPAPDFVVEIRIVTPASVLRTGQTLAFVALAYDQAGRVVPGQQFEWTSSIPGVATIDADGLATAGAQVGTTEIVASLTTPQGTITSNAVELTTLAPVANGDTRVTVLRAQNGTAIVGAQVQFDDGANTQTLMTDATGSVTVAGLTAPFDVTVAHDEFDYVSILEAGADDLLVHLNPATRIDRAAGIVGGVDLSQVSSTGELSLSLSGTSIPSPLLNYGGTNVFGADVVNVNIMGQNIQLPAANTVAVEVFGSEIPLKSEYLVRGTPGLRAAWSFGGRVEFNFGGGGLPDLNNLIAFVLPYFQRFDHDVAPRVNMLAIPTVADTADLDGDGDLTELIPDWDNFLNQPMTPSVAQSLRYALSVDNLPVVSGGNANTLVIVSGSILPGVGFVPLGLDGQTDDNGSGIVASFVTKMAPSHGGLEAGRYAVLATTVRIDGGLPGPGSARVFVSDALPRAVDLSDGWLDSPLGATWNDVIRSAAVPTVVGADVLRVEFASDSGRWHVYAPALSAASLLIPAPPAGMIDRTESATVAFDAIDLSAGATLDTAFDIAEGGLLGVDGNTRGFSRAFVE